MGTFKQIKQKKLQEMKDTLIEKGEQRLKELEAIKSPRLIGPTIIDDDDLLELEEETQNASMLTDDNTSINTTTDIDDLDDKTALITCATEFQDLTDEADRIKKETSIDIFKQINDLFE